MPCYHPIKGYQSKDLSVNGKRQFVISSNKSNGNSLTIPCGQCIGCRLERSRQWAARILCESQMYDKNCFITLTYAPEFLPKNGTLVLDDFQKFMKRLRKKHGKLRFFHCGEYGEQLKRPHYHACIFGFDFPDKRFVSSSPRGDDSFVSESLSELWPYGHHQIGSLTFESAAYVARYCVKKITGPMQESHYNGIVPEYCTMSRRPGIGASWLDKFSSDVYNFDSFITRGGIRMRPPRAFDRRFELINPDAFKRIQDARDLSQMDICSAEQRRFRLDNTPERLKVREAVHLATVNTTLNRKYEE